ncbi:MAG: terpene cyclase/mutase family protein [Lentisphaerae bacterium]|nr:terpene cyclase/mutase family protein [Lentisphaerota bacterium]
METLTIITTVLLLAALPAAAAEDQVETAKLTPEVRAAIDRGLAFLAKRQNDDGRFEGQGTGSGQHPVCDTALALMAFMVQGHVPGRGEYGRTMDAAIAYLIGVAEKNTGYLGGSMYEHGLATLALSEAWGHSKNNRIRDALRAAVDVTLRAQNGAGGWRYQPLPVDADLSVTVMQLVALNSAREAGIAVPDQTIRKAVNYVLKCWNPSGGGFCYQPSGGEENVRFATTAAGAMSLIMSGQRDHPRTRQALAILAAYPDVKFRARSVPYWLYSHYYAIQDMYQGGDKFFQPWYPEIAATLVNEQWKDGSWQIDEGPIFSTGMAILILGVPYRFVPIYQR